MKQFIRLLAFGMVTLLAVAIFQMYGLKNKIKYLQQDNERTEIIKSTARQLHKYQSEMIDTIKIMEGNTMKK